MREPRESAGKKWNMAVGGKRSTERKGHELYYAGLEYVLRRGS